MARDSRRLLSRAGLFRALVRIGLVLSVALALCGGLVYFGILRSPFEPSARGDLELARGELAGLRVLFVGNSMTYGNSMPKMVGQLAAADDGGLRIFVAQYTAPGWAWADAARDEGLAELMSSVRWDVVILQEQSQLLSFPRDQRAEVIPWVRMLDYKVRSSGARTLLFMTWGHREGDRRNVVDDTFEAMQARLRRGYEDVAVELFADVVPVGMAWAAALERRPGLELWAGDGKHPSRLGSYLAACVFYAVLSDRPATASAFTGGIALPEARFLQRVATDVARSR